MTLQRRLLLSIVLVAPLVWLGFAGIAWWRAHHEIDEFYDTGMVRFAREVVAMLPDEIASAATLPHAGEPGGAAELDSMSVAVWDGGRRLLSDAEGAALPWREGVEGFVDTTLDGRRWRLFYLRDANRPSRVVAVGQDARERDELAQGLIAAQMLPWLASLPLLLVALGVGVRRALAPLRRLTRDVERRDAADLKPIDAAGVPDDLAPLLSAVNRLLARLDGALRQERRFTADAAHELRTPIAALRAQWDAACLTEDPAQRRAVQDGLGAGIDRLGHLVSQMLVLARADAGPTGVDAPIDLRAVVERVIGDTLPAIDARDAQVEVAWPPEGVAPMPLSGDATLVVSMLRNLVDNAVRYGPVGGRVMMRMTPDRIEVEDEGPGLDEEQRAMLGERFRRPAGASSTGSGLGVSIAMRVAALHGLTLRFDAGTRAGRMPGLRVTLLRAAF
jgi:two-component system sensor histidine kinase QseC